MKHRALLALAFASIPTLALADPAEDHLAKGTNYYNIQEWASALKEYKESYALDPKPDTLWAIAQTQRLSGDCRSAILTYKAYMRTASAAGATVAQEFITKCQADIEAQQRAIDAPPPTVSPPPPVVVNPPIISPQPQPMPPPQRASTHHGSWAFDPLGDVLFVVGVGGLATGATFLALGNRDMSAAKNELTVAAYEGATSDAKQKQQIGMIATSAGAVFTGLAIWRFVAVARRHNREDAQNSLAIVPTRDGAFASYLVSF